jgi:hypothetical protein
VNRPLLYALSFAKTASDSLGVDPVLLGQAQHFRKLMGGWSEAGQSVSSGHRPPPRQAVGLSVGPVTADSKDSAGRRALVVGAGPGEVGSCRPSNVPMMQATDLGNRDDPADLRPLDWPAVGCVFVQREVSSRAVIVHEVCVQRRQTCSVGGSPTGATARRPVAWKAGRRETKALKPIDDTIGRMGASDRAVT